ncbi:hypothetical protein JCM4914_08590 [Streptomyces platensis subsp. malvinus]
MRVVPVPVRVVRGLWWGRDMSSDISSDISSAITLGIAFLHRSRRETGSTEPRGGVPVASGPAAAAEKETTQRHAGYSNHTSTPQTT